jgi:hypothetical protein
MIIFLTPCSYENSKKNKICKAIQQMNFVKLPHYQEWNLQPKTALKGSYVIGNKI